MPTFRSDSSSATNLAVNVYEIGRSDTQVHLRCDWSVTTGSATSLGNASGNWRNLRLYLSNGTCILDQQIKAAAAYWYASSTYSGTLDFWLDVGTYDAGSASIYLQTNNTGTPSCIWTNRSYCTDFSVSWSLFWSAASAPTTPGLSPNYFENILYFSWGAGSSGINNAVLNYYLHYRLVGVQEVVVDLGLSTSWTLDSSSISRGQLVDFFVATITQRFDNPVSGLSNQVMKNRAPYAPTSPSVPQTSYIPGDSIRVSFSNNGDPDGNLAGFEVATNVDETIIGTSGAGASYVDVNTTGWPQGIQRSFRVRAYDANAIRSSWSSYTAMVTLNTAPNVPEISFPAAGAVLYNKQPHILLKAGTINDGPQNILCLTDSVERTTALNGSLFSCGVNNALTSGRQLVFKPSSDFSASPTISSRMYDSFLYSSAVSRSFGVVTFSPTDPDLTVPGTKIKAAHITDIRTATNNLRTAYGLAAFAWTAITAGITSIGNATIIIELQEALQAVLDRINGWDTSNSTFDIAVSWVNPAATGGGVDRVKLRQAIEQLRATIQLI